MKSFWKALFYTVISGPHEGDVYSHNQTPVSIPKVFSPYLDGVKIGVDWTWAKMASTEVYRNFESQIKNLENAGAKIINIEVPEVQLINVGHIGICLTLHKRCHNNLGTVGTGQKF